MVPKHKVTLQVDCTETNWQTDTHTQTDGRQGGRLRYTLKQSWGQATVLNNIKTTSSPFLSDDYTLFKSWNYVTKQYEENWCRIYFGYLDTRYKVHLSETVSLNWVHPCNSILPGNMTATNNMVSKHLWGCTRIISDLWPLSHHCNVRVCVFCPLTNVIFHLSVMLVHELQQA